MATKTSVRSASLSLKFKPKYYPGTIINSIEGFNQWTLDGGWIWYKERPVNPKIMRNFQFNHLCILIAHKMLRLAIQYNDT